jgi:hypothetical protein
MLDVFLLLDNEQFQNPDIYKILQSLLLTKENQWIFQQLFFEEPFLYFQ